MLAVKEVRDTQSDDRRNELVELTVAKKAKNCEFIVDCYGAHYAQVGCNCFTCELRFQCHLFESEIDLYG